MNKENGGEQLSTSQMVGDVQSQSQKRDQITDPEQYSQAVKQEQQPISDSVQPINQDIQPISKEITPSCQENLPTNQTIQIKQEKVLSDNETDLNDQPMKNEHLFEPNNHEIQQFRLDTQPISHENLQIKGEIIISDDETDYNNQPVKQENLTYGEVTHGSRSVSHEIQRNGVTNEPETNNCQSQDVEYRNQYGQPMVDFELQNIQLEQVNEDIIGDEPLCLIKTENFIPKNTNVDEQCQKQADDNAEKKETFFLCNTCSEEKDRMIIFSTGLLLAKHVIAVHQSSQITGPNFQFTCYGEGVKYHCFPVVQEMIFVCKIGNCPKRFGNQQLLYNHMEACHKKENEHFNLKCHYRTCNRKFSCQDDRREHIQEFHVDYGFDIQDSYGAVWIIKCLPFGGLERTIVKTKETQIQKHSLSEIQTFFSLTYHFGSIDFSTFDEFTAKLNSTEETLLNKGPIIGPSLVALQRFEKICHASQVLEEIKLSDIEFIVNVNHVQDRMLHGGVTVHNSDTDCVYFVDDLIDDNDDTDLERTKPVIPDLKAKDIEMDIGDLVFLYGKPDPNYSAVYDVEQLCSDEDDVEEDIPVPKNENFDESCHETPAIVIDEATDNELDMEMNSSRSPKCKNEGNNKLGDSGSREALTIALDPVDQTLYCLHEKYGTLEKPSSINKNFKPNLKTESTEIIPIQNVQTDDKTDDFLFEAQMNVLGVNSGDSHYGTNQEFNNGSKTSRKEKSKSKLNRKSSRKDKSNKLNQEKNSELVHTWTDEQIGNCISIPESCDSTNFDASSKNNEHFHFIDNFSQEEVDKLLSVDVLSDSSKSRKPLTDKQQAVKFNKNKNILKSTSLTCNDVKTEPGFANSSKNQKSFTDKQQSVKFQKSKNIPKSTSLSCKDVKTEQDISIPQKEHCFGSENETIIDKSVATFTSLKQESAIEADVEEVSSVNFKNTDKSHDHDSDLKIKNDIHNEEKSSRSHDHLNNIKIEKDINNGSVSHRKNDDLNDKTSNKLMLSPNFISGNKPASKMSHHFLKNDFRHNISKKFGLNYHSRKVDSLPFPQNRKSLNIQGSKVNGQKSPLSQKSMEESKDKTKQLPKTDSNLKNTNCDNQQSGNKKTVDDSATSPRDNIKLEDLDVEIKNMFVQKRPKKRKRVKQFASSIINGIEIKDCSVKVFKLDKNDVEYICHEMKLGHKTEYADYLYTMRKSDARNFDHLKNNENKISMSPGKAKRILEICRNQFKMNKFFFENQNDGSLRSGRKRSKLSKKGKLKRGKLCDDKDSDWTMVSDDSSSMSSDSEEDSVEDFDLDDDECICPECDLSFSRLSFLENHIARKHKDNLYTERKFCPVENCDASYSGKYALLTHIKKDHGEEAYKEIQSELYGTREDEPQTRPAGSCLMPTVWRNPQPLIPPHVKDKITKTAEKEQPKNVKEVEDIKNILSDFTQSNKGSFYSILSNK